MTVKLTLTAALPEARRIANFLERDFSHLDVAISLEERGPQWAVEAYFDAEDREQVEADIRDRLGSDAFGAPMQVEELPETDWVALSLEGLKPVPAGRFLVHGGHDRATLPSGRIAIQIEAGQAFGTGHHGTTAGCLIVLDRLMRRRRFRHPLDLGTGSGVLAIALAKVLRAPVLATDLDPVAIQVARENAVLNGVGRSVQALVANGVSHPAIRAEAPFDLIVANILAEPLMRLARGIAEMLEPGGTLVLSGLLPHQRERVVAAYGIQGVRLVEGRIFAGWAVLVLQRP